MYITTALINTKRCAAHTRKLLNNRYRVHQIVESSLDHDKTVRIPARTLWSIYHIEPDTLTLRITSPTPPHKQTLQSALGRNALINITDDIEEPAPITGERINFTLFANPVVCRRPDNTRRPIHSRTGLEHWLTSRAHALGISDLDIVDMPTSRHTIHRKNVDFSLHLATYTGSATIADAQRYDETLRFGVGKSLAFGSGMFIPHMWIDPQHKTATHMAPLALV